jgi:Coenzyme PQQ synthesis protein D (PqqD)
MDGLKSKASVVQRLVAGETFLVPIHGHIADMQELFVVNEVGRFLWDRLDGETSVEGLVTDVVSEFEVSEAQARCDTEAFLQQLTQAGLAEQKAASEG